MTMINDVLGLNVVNFFSAPQCWHCKSWTRYGNSVRLSVRASVYLSHAGIGDQILKFVVFHTSFDNKGREVCCKVSLCKTCQRQSCSAINCLSSDIKMLAGGRSLSPEILVEADPPPPEGSEF